MKTNNINGSYVSPEIRTIRFNLSQTICGSMTEAFTVGSDSYDEDDFTE